MTEFSDDTLAKFSHLADSLLEKVRPEFGQQIKLAPSLFGAIQYVSYVIFPDSKSRKSRQSFQRAAVWLVVKESSHLDKKEATELLNTFQIDYPEKYSYKNAQENMNDADKRFAKALEAWQAFDYAQTMGTPIKDALLASGIAYKRGLVSKDKDPNEYAQNSKNRIIKPYRGVLHLTAGLVSSCCTEYSLEKLNIYIPISTSRWVENAIDISISSLKSRLLDKHLQSKGINSGPKLVLRPDEIVIVMR